jgi:hypothetical protein
MVVKRKSEKELWMCGKRRRRICVIGEEAENGLQRTVRPNNRSKTMKNTE